LRDNAPWLCIEGYYITIIWQSNQTLRTTIR
jgi:hypothetical protein